MTNEVYNSDMLFIYDAKDTNPNGDPDNENQPRMDATAQRLLVTDVRLKRYLRDHLQYHHVKDLGEGVGPALWIPTVTEITDGKRRYAALQKHLGVEAKTNRSKAVEALTAALIDVRMFGAVFPGGDKDSINLAGPVQFGWGESLHPVEPHETRSITSHFASGATQTQGTIGKDWRIKYALIGFHGIIDGNRAKETGLTSEDVDLFDIALWESIITQATTRSKQGQYPRLYLRIEYDGIRRLGDLRDYVSCERGTDEPGLKSVKLDLTDVVSRIKQDATHIRKVVLRVDPRLQATGLDKLQAMLGGKLDRRD